MFNPVGIIDGCIGARSYKLDMMGLNSLRIPIWIFV